MVDINWFLHPFCTAYATKVTPKFILRKASKNLELNVNFGIRTTDRFSVTFWAVSQRTSCVPWQLHKERSSKWQGAPAAKCNYLVKALSQILRPLLTLSDPPFYGDASSTCPAYIALSGNHRKRPLIGLFVSQCTVTRSHLLMVAHSESVQLTRRG
jgi:hypothetical protein